MIYFPFLDCYNIVAYFLFLSGYYQNEKEAFPEDDDDPFSNEVDNMLDQLSEAPTGSLPSTASSINPHGTYPDKKVVIPVAVANPDYFEDGSEIWKQKMSKNNGYISVPNTSPVHQITKNGLGPNYRKINNCITPNSSQTVNSRVNFPGVQSNRYEAKVWICLQRPSPWTNSEAFFRA